MLSSRWPCWVLLAEVALTAKPAPLDLFKPLRLESVGKLQRSFQTSLKNSVLIRLYWTS